METFLFESVCDHRTGH